MLLGNTLTSRARLLIGYAPANHPFNRSGNSSLFIRKITVRRRHEPSDCSWPQRRDGRIRGGNYRFSRARREAFALSLSFLSESTQRRDRAYAARRPVRSERRQRQLLRREMGT